jgi:hypothetical protein
MNTATNFAAHYLADISKNQDEIENAMKDFPASSVVRFLWLYQLKLNNDSRFEDAARQVGIYLQNPYWIQFQLSDSTIAKENDLETSSIISPEISKTEVENETQSQSIDSNNQNSISQNEFQDIQNNEEVKDDESIISDENKTEELFQTVNEKIPINHRDENPILENEFQNVQNDEEVKDDESIVSDENKVDEIIEQKSEEELPQKVNETIPINHRDENPVSENEFQDAQNDEEAKEDESIVSDENKVDEITEQKSEEELPEAVNEPALPVNETIPITHRDENPVSENEFQDAQNDEEAKDDESIISDKNKVEEITEQKSEEELPQTVNETIPINHRDENPVSENEEDNNEAIPFEPLHTVDYFASQGIKLSEEALQNDQLGKQVKSFTAWLKSMKKLHPGQLPEQNEVIERLIQTSSEVSNQNANVLTEAMAEVLVKQDKREKAIEMYQKLSLLNPSKSAYFAAKIESLKSI